MNKNIFDIKISKSGIDEIIDNWFNGVEINRQYLYDVFEKDVKFATENDASLKNIDICDCGSKSLIAIVYYRVCNYVYKHYGELSNVCRNVMERVAGVTNVDIHPQADIGVPFYIDHGCGVVVGQTTKIGNFCILYNDVILGSKVGGQGECCCRHPQIDDYVIVSAGARLFGNIKVGSNVKIGSRAVVLDDVEDNCRVSVVNQLQVSKQTNSIPSQKLIIYGVIPKYKNTIHIYGEGFYNPTVLLKLRGDKQVLYNLTYWDKNKIIVKIKNTTPFEHSVIIGCKIIVLSNSEKCIITGSYGLNKILLNLQN